MPDYKGTVKLTPHECYTALMTQSIAEIKRKTGKELTVEELEKGYKYKVKKKVGNDVKDASVHFSRPDRDRRITVHYSLENSFYDMNYEFREIEPGKTEVTYSQIMKNEKKLNFIEDLMFRSRVRRWLKLIEREMIKLRKK